MRHPKAPSRLAWTAALCAIAACGEDAIVPGQGAADAAVDTDTAGAATGDTARSGGTTIVANVAGAMAGPRVALTVTDSQGDEVVVQIALRDIPDLFGVAGHLRFDPAAVTIVEAKPHTVLADADWQGRTLVKIADGRLLLGGARVRVGGSPYAPLAGATVGNQLWVTLRLRKLTAAPTTLSFDPERALARASSYDVLTLGWQSLTLSGGGGR